MDEYCRAAGSIGAETVQRQFHAQRRQINSILSSIGGEITSFLSSASITIALPTLTSNTPQASVTPPAATTPRSSAVQSVPTSVVSTPAVPVSNSATTPTRSQISSLVTKTSSDLSQSTAQSTSSSSSAASSSSSTSSSPSAGLIAGAVIGGIAVLVLLGILLMLILRHKRKKATTNRPSTIENGDGSIDGTASYRGEPSVETIAAVESRTGDEKSVYQSRTSEPLPPPQQAAPPLPRGNEMATSANVWELDGRERPPPAELEAQHTYIPYRMSEAKTEHEMSGYRGE
ncbi:Nn.00g054310.m01.CDS01 [Neocucurbitaria sp. VM-36]